MIISTKERSYLIRKQIEKYLLMYDQEEDDIKGVHLLERVEELEDELERIASEYE